MNDRAAEFWNCWGGTECQGTSWEFLLNPKRHHSFTVFLEKRKQEREEETKERKGKKKRKNKRKEEGKEERKEERKKIGSNKRSRK